MPLPRRLIAAAIGLVLPLAVAATAQAAPHHRHPAHVQTATYKVVPHKVVHRRHASLTSHRVAQAAAHRHPNMRGS